MIRCAKENDLPEILRIYEYARGFMARTGNPNQWTGGHPREELLRDDIAKRQLYVLEDETGLHGVFAFIIGDDPTYAVIEQGAWRSSAPYGTIHRIASDGQIHGFLQSAVDFCWQRIPHLRIDTHADNRVMQHLIVKCGFTQCGVIRLENGDPRIAYEKEGTFVRGKTPSFLEKK